MNLITQIETQKDVQDIPVVGIGVTKEGINVLKEILSDIPQDSGMAYIITQYFSADFPDNLSEILSQYTQIPVHEIINDINLEPNHIYIMPENNLLTATDGILKLKRITRSEKQNNAVDVFFESLSEVHKSCLIGIILLSDVVQDGALGFKKIKEAGGVTIVQNSKKAQGKAIPQSLADTTDYVMGAEHIPSQLFKIQQKCISNYAYNDDEKISENDQEVIDKILNIIFLNTGNEFRNYKQSAIRRRIIVRMAVMQKDTLEDYYILFQSSKKEQDILFNELLILITYFFRDQESFDRLKQTVFPSLIENATNNTLRIWVAGCTTGEEAYSIAIELHEYLLETNNKNIKVQIFASDLSEKSINRAKAGIYSAQDVQHTSEERLHTYFTKRSGQYHVSEIIRDRCIFAVHNVLKDPPFSKIDFLSCRNVLTYFNPFLQNKVLSTFHYSLKENGILFLGKSESVSKAQDLFESAAKNDKIYIRKSVLDRNLSPSYKSGPHTILGKINSESENDSEIKPLQNNQDRIDELERELSVVSEELQLANKELKSANKELESNKEELIFVNNELKDSQKHHISMRDYSESVIKIIHEPLVIIDKNYSIKSANSAFYNYFKLKDIEAEGKSFFEIGNSELNIAEFKEEISKVIYNKEIIRNFKVDMVCNGRENKTMLINACQIQNSNEKLILLAINDMTDLMNANKLLVGKKSELEKHCNQLETFTSAASHNILEPLQKIHMFSKRIYDTEKSISESGKHDLERLQHLILNMSQLINDLISYSKVNYVEKEYKKTDLNLLLKRNVRDLKEIISQKKASVIIGQLPELYVIPHQIQQLFRSLIMNSIKYSKENVSPEIKIETKPFTDDEITEMGGNPEIHYVKICVTDNGIGFDKGYEKRIFEPFYKLHTTSHYKGSGLGLTLVKKIVANHRGYIKGISELNQGTTIVIYLPL